MDSSLLEGVGLTKLEIKVYLALLDLGSASAGSISTKSGVHRRSVYDALDRLLEKGLVTLITINNTKEYQAVNPKRLIGLVKEKQDDIQEILPQLILKHNMAKETQDFRFFKGKEGIKSILDDQLRIGKPTHVINGSKEIYELLPYYIKHYDAHLRKKGIKTKVIFNDNVRPVGKPDVAEVKYLPEEYCGMTSINIYGDNVAILLWSKDEPLGIVISHKEIAKSYMNYFNLLWEIAEN